MSDFLPFKVAVGAVDAVLPGGGAFAEHVGTAFRQGWERRQSRTYRTALATSGLSEKDLQQAMAHNPRAQSLITRALLHAAMINDGPLLDALGAAWGRAVADPTQLDEAERLVIGIGLIRPEDAQVLKVMAEDAVFVGTARDETETEVSEDSAVLLAAKCGLSYDTVVASLVRLNNAGFTHGFHGVYGGGSAYEVSRVGRLLREVLTALQ